MKARFPEAPELLVQTWFNAPNPLSLASLRGKVVVLHAFQMLCPGCVAHGLPQAKAIHEAFPDSEVAVIGLHTVFEHHAAMTPEALKAFIHEYRLSFPIAVDHPSPGGGVPRTMQAYQMRGTPTLIILDRQGRIRFHQFGRVDDLRVGAVIGTLLEEVAPAREGVAPEGCTEEACSI